MSKNITIQEGGTANQLTVDKLKTNLVGSGSCLWVPEGEVQLTTKTVTENGTYKASDDGYYGYSQVTVSCIGTVSGTDPETGEDVVVGTDQTTGEITKTTVPHSIRVVTPPYNQYGIYQDGQAISTNGMEVRALLASGDLYDSTEYPEGLIPNTELTLNPTTAIYDASTDPGGEVTGDGVTASVLYPSVQINPRDPSDVRSIYYGSGFDERGLLSVPSIFITGDKSGVTLYMTTYNGHAYGMIKGASTLYVGYSTDNTMGGAFQLNNIRFSEIMSDDSELTSLFPSSESSPIGKSVDDMEPVQAGSRQQITVSWPRPLDGKVLETTFEILVAPPYSSGED